MISDSLINSLTSYSFNPDHQHAWVNHESNFLFENNVFIKAIIVNIKADDVSFIPTATYKRIMDKLYRLPKEGDTSIICSLPIFGRDTKKSPDNIIKRLFEINDKEGLIRVTGKDTSYIGGTGIIFDSHWNPLMMTGMEIRDVLLWDRDVARIVGPKVYISPEVFTRTDVISKTIAKKIIPWYGSHYVFSSVLSSYSRRVPENIRIAIEDFSHMFLEPKAPSQMVQKGIHQMCEEVATRLPIYDHR